MTHDTLNNRVSLTFPALIKSGIAYLSGYKLALNYSINIKPSSISHEFTYFNLSAFSVKAGTNSSLYIYPVDKYGNSLSIKNGEISLSQFTSAVKVY
jgi:hypothetical protein